MTEPTLKEDVHEFDTNPDFELTNSIKSRKTTYKIFNPGPGKSLVVYIPGFGGDLGEYTEVFCRKISSQYNVATMYVNYHCIQSRFATGAKLQFELQDKKHIANLLLQAGATPTKNDEENLKLLTAICYKQQRKEILFCSLYPGNGEYQNFGILAALDIVNAVRHAVHEYGLEKNDIRLVGASYGGYVANLVTKIAPGYIRSVYDNSSWAFPNLQYVAGREIMHADYYLKVSDNVTLACCTKTPWTLVPGLPNSFADSKYLIRTFNNNQLLAMANQGGTNSTFYCYFHSHRDKIAPTEEKQKMVDTMNSFGFRIYFKILTPTDVDGTFIKNMTHGMDMSMLQLFGRCNRIQQERNYAFQSTMPDATEYSFDDRSYHFDLSRYPVRAWTEE